MIEAADYLALSARLQPERPAARDLTPQRSWSYRELDASAARFAAALVARGIVAGDRVAALARNRVALIALHAACARLGAIYVPLNWRLAPSEIAALIADSEPRFTLADELSRAEGIETLDLQAFVDEAAAASPLPARQIDRERPSLILYTSGTSGRPKGALLSEGAIDQTALNFSLLARVTHESVFLCETPMFHVIGLVATIRSALMRGAALMISDGFAVARTLARLSDPALGVTHYFCVPAMAAMLRADSGFEARGLKGLTAIFTGGAPHPPAAIRRWLADGIAIADGFGMSETGTYTCMPLDLALIDAHAGSAGLAPPGVALRIVDEQGNDRRPGEAGELLIRGANVTSRLLARARRNRGCVHLRRLAAQRRHRPPRRRRLFVARRSQEGHVCLRRRERLSRRDRGRSFRASRHRRMRRRRRGRREMGRGRPSRVDARGRDAPSPPRTSSPISARGSRIIRRPATSPCSTRSRATGPAR